MTDYSEGKYDAITDVLVSLNKLKNRVGLPTFQAEFNALCKELETKCISYYHLNESGIGD